MARSKVLHIASLLLVLAVGFAAGSYVQIQGKNSSDSNLARQLEKDKLKEVKELKNNINSAIEKCMEEDIATYMDDVETDDEIVGDYPEMTESEKAEWFRKNEKFYLAMDQGYVLISPLYKPYFYDNRAGNNKIVQNIVSRYNTQYQEYGKFTFLGYAPYYVVTDTLDAPESPRFATCEDMLEERWKIERGYSSTVIQDKINAIFDSYLKDLAVAN